MGGDVWTKDQIGLILKCLVLRIKRDPTAVTIKREGKDVRFDNIAQSYAANSTHRENFYITLNEGDNRIFVNIADQRDHCTISAFPWWDKELRELRKVLLGLAPHTAHDATLQKMFPEILDIVVEDTVLKGQDGQQDKATE